MNEPITYLGLHREDDVTLGKKTPSKDSMKPCLGGRVCRWEPAGENPVKLVPEPVPSFGGDRDSCDSLSVLSVSAPVSQASQHGQHLGSRHA